MANTTRPSRGHKKKARTRQSLLEAGVRVYGEHGSTMTVAHVVAEAHVSHGTFYNYFQDLDALIGAVVLHVLQELTESVARDRIPDPARRFAVATTLMFRQVAARTEFARVLLRFAVRFREGDPLFANLYHDLAEGRASGRFSSDEPDVTVVDDMILGTMLMVMHRIANGRWSTDRCVSTVSRLLVLLGINPDEADSFVVEAMQIPLPTPSSRRSS